MLRAVGIQRRDTSEAGKVGVGFMGVELDRQERKVESIQVRTAPRMKARRWEKASARL